eukprot:349655-Chlamydomonas_euryale.AAC.11
MGLMPRKEDVVSHLDHAHVADERSNVERVGANRAPNRRVLDARRADDGVERRAMAQQRAHRVDRALEHRDVQRGEAPAVVAVDERHLRAVLAANELCDRHLLALRNSTATARRRSGATAQQQRGGVQARQRTGAR